MSDVPEARSRLRRALAHVMAVVSQPLAPGSVLPLLATGTVGRGRFASLAAHVRDETDLGHVTDRVDDGVRLALRHPTIRTRHPAARS